MKCYPTECLVTCTTHTYEICQANVVSYKRCLSEHQNYGPSSHMGSARSRYLFITIHRSRSLSRFWKDNKRIENNRSHIRKPLKGDCKGCVSWLPMMDDKGQKKTWFELNLQCFTKKKMAWTGTCAFLLLKAGITDHVSHSQLCGRPEKTAGLHMTLCIVFLCHDSTILNIISLRYTAWPLQPNGDPARRAHVGGAGRSKGSSQQRHLQGSRMGKLRKGWRVPKHVEHITQESEITGKHAKELNIWPTYFDFVI